MTMRCIQWCNRAASDAVDLLAVMRFSDFRAGALQVQKPKRKEVPPQPVEVAPRPPPPARKASSGQLQPVERPPEWQRQTTLAEAAGLRQPHSAELEAAPSPWASQQSAGLLSTTHEAWRRASDSKVVVKARFSESVGCAGAKSLLDIQKEEAMQAKARASSDALQQAAVLQQAPKPASSWGKSIARASPPGTIRHATVPYCCIQPAQPLTDGRRLAQ